LLGTVRNLYARNRHLVQYVQCFLQHNVDGKVNHVLFGTAFHFDGIVAFGHAGKDIGLLFKAVQHTGEGPFQYRYFVAGGGRTRFGYLYVDVADGDGFGGAGNGGQILKAVMQDEQHKKDNNRKQGKPDANGHPHQRKGCGAYG
jgi:hypothetical protein